MKIKIALLVMSLSVLACQISTVSLSHTERQKDDTAVVSVAPSPLRTVESFLEFTHKK